MERSLNSIAAWIADKPCFELLAQDSEALDFWFFWAKPKELGPCGYEQWDSNKKAGFWNYIQRSRQAL
ncbi:MAG: hypothetical protein JWQ25_415 [Daejeonella sp.]|nr:hypothetical protein [Daejeonella sp.]